MKKIIQAVTVRLRARTSVLRTGLHNARLNLALKILPQNHFAQRVPFFAPRDGMGFFPCFKDESAAYTRALIDAGQKRERIEDGNRVLSLLLLLRLARDLPEGDYAELGTFRGALARLIWRHRHPDAGLYCFDTFDGFTERDVVAERQQTQVKAKVGRFAQTSEELVRRYVTGVAEGDAAFHTVKGWFPDSFAGHEGRCWRFVHLDADLYQPTKAGLERFWPNLVPGGILVMHDFNAGYVGVEKASREFFAPLGITPVPLCDNGGSAVVIKPRQ